jgi:hypothetical protein
VIFSGWENPPISKKQFIAVSIFLTLAVSLTGVRIYSDSLTSNQAEIPGLKNNSCDKIDSSVSTKFETPLPIRFKSTSSLNKVFFDNSLDSVRGSSYQLDIELAKNEYEASQLLISADSRIANVSVEVSDLINCNTQSTLKANDHVEINAIAYINVNMEEQKSDLEEPILR